MKNLSLFTSVILLSLAGASAYGTALVEVTAVIGSSVCTGNNAVCNQVVTLTKGGGGGLVNAIAGTKFKLDTKTAKSTALGTVDADKNAEVNLSVKDGGNTLYSFEPKDTGKKTYVAFQSSVPSAGKLGAGRVIVTAYRQFEGDAADNWQWRGAFSLERAKLEPVDGVVAAEATITPDGRLAILGSTFDIGG